MMRNFLSYAPLLVLGLVPGVIQAQDTVRDQERPGLDSIRKVSEWLGAPIRNSGNESLGKVEDLLFDEQGQLRYLVAEHGGVAGLGATHVAIPARAARLGTLDEKPAFLINVSKEMFDTAPALTSEDYDELNNADWSDGNKTTFGLVDPADEPARRLCRASNLMGAKVRGEGSETLGGIEELLLDGEHGLAYAIVGSDEVLGVGGDHTAVPYGALGLTADDNETVLLSMTREAFDAAPPVKEDYEQLRDKNFVNLVQEHFNIR